MPVVVVANPKGGVGKSTLSTNVAGYFASEGHGVMLGDADRQQSSALWLRLRPLVARPIQGWGVSLDLIARPPGDATPWTCSSGPTRCRCRCSPAASISVPRGYFWTNWPRHARRSQVGIAGMRVAGAPHCGCEVARVR
jgi:hypothetical protein